MHSFLPPHRAPRAPEGRDCGKTTGAANAFCRRCRSGVTSLHHPEENEAAPHAPIPPHPVSSSSRGRAPRRAIPKVGPPSSCFPPHPPAHAHSGAVPAHSPLLPPRVPHRRPRRQSVVGREGLGKSNQRAQLRHSEAGEPRPHTKLGAAEPGEDLFLVSHTPTKGGGTAFRAALTSKGVPPPSRAHTDPPFPRCLSSPPPPQVPITQPGPRAALPVPELHSLGMHILLPTDTQHAGASRTLSPAGHIVLFLPRKAAGVPTGQQGEGMQGEEQHRNLRNLTASQFSALHPFFFPRFRVVPHTWSLGTIWARRMNST